MNEGVIMLPKYQCQRCSHSWIPRAEEIPTVCPKCKSPWWNKPRKINDKPEDVEVTDNGK
jgi:predicted Zn-ribbon and HTH transcriptional regulator